MYDRGRLVKPICGYLRGEDQLEHLQEGIGGMRISNRLPYHAQRVLLAAVQATPIRHAEILGRDHSQPRRLYQSHTPASALFRVPHNRVP